MGRMKKADKIITDYKISVTYTCPITKEKVDMDLIDIMAYESECDMCGSHGAITIEVPVKCPSCKKTHNDIEYKSW